METVFLTHHLREGSEDKPVVLASVTHILLSYCCLPSPPAPFMMDSLTGKEFVVLMTVRCVAQTLRPASLTTATTVLSSRSWEAHVGVRCSAVTLPLCTGPRQLSKSGRRKLSFRILSSIHTHKPVCGYKCQPCWQH